MIHDALRILDEAGNQVPPGYLLGLALISAVLGPVAVILANSFVSRRTGQRVAAQVDAKVGAVEAVVVDKVEAVHHEVMPPSNGTTSGAMQEFTSGWVSWIYAELVSIGRHLGIDPHGPPPELVVAEVPPRPEERRRPRHLEGTPDESQGE